VEDSPGPHKNILTNLILKKGRIGVYYSYSPNKKKVLIKAWNKFYKNIKGKAGEKPALRIINSG